MSVKVIFDYRMQVSMGLKYPEECLEQTGKQPGVWEMKDSCSKIEK